MINNWIQTVDCKINRVMYIKPDSIVAILPVRDVSWIYLKDGLELTIATNYVDLLPVCGIDDFVSLVEVELEQGIYVRKSSITIFAPYKGGCRIKTLGNFSFTVNMHVIDLILLCRKNIVKTLSIKSIMTCLPSIGMEK